LSRIFFHCCPSYAGLIHGRIGFEASKSYAVVLATARDKIAFAEVGINALRRKRIITGGVILEIPATRGGRRHLRQPRS
jgi:uncharacterized membrane protein YecN with MAPEG domain